MDRGKGESSQSKTIYIHITSYPLSIIAQYVEPLLSIEAGFYITAIHTRELLHCPTVSSNPASSQGFQVSLTLGCFPYS